MATPSVAASGELKYEKLSELYVALWNQLEMVTDEGKWMEVRPEGGAALSEDIRRMLAEAAPLFGDADLWSAIYRDYERTQELILGGAHGNKSEVDSFREYLRDKGTRYAELADSDPVTGR